MTLILIPRYHQEIIIKNIIGCLNALCKINSIAATTKTRGKGRGKIEGDEEMGRLSKLSWSAGVAIVMGLLSASIQSALALPPPEDTPEEILRTEIILEARSPVDGKLLTAAEYAELQAQLQTRPAPPQLNPKVGNLIFLLRLRKAILTVLPFLPI